MSIDPDVTAHLDTPNLSAVKVVAAIRGISVHAARAALLPEWDQRLADAIASEIRQAEHWAGMASDAAATGDYPGADEFICRDRPCPDRHLIESPRDGSRMAGSLLLCWSCGHLRLSLVRKNRNM